MPIILTVDHNNQQVHAVAIGQVSYADVEDHLMAERSFEGLAHSELVDARAGAGAGARRYARRAAHIGNTADARALVQSARRFGALCPEWWCSPTAFGSERSAANLA